MPITRREFIDCPYGMQVKLAEEAGCSRLTVANALKGYSRGPIAQKVIELAEKKYGLKTAEIKYKRN